MKPYPDQQKSIDEIFEEFKTKKRILSFFIRIKEVYL